MTYNIFYSKQVPDTEDEGSPNDLKEFTKLLLDGQKIANDSRKTHFFVWRGYKGCISSELPKLNKHAILRRFHLAKSFLQSDKQEFFQSSQMSSSGRSSSSSSSRGSSSSIQSDDRQVSQNLDDNQLSQDVTQVPETQTEGNNCRWRYVP